MTPRYTVRISIHDNSFNVIDTHLVNQWGEPWVEDPALTFEQAKARARELNQKWADSLIAAVG